MNKTKMSFEAWKKLLKEFMCKDLIDTPKTPLKFWYDNGLSVDSVIELIRESK